ncbi:hypothetical protein PGT21_013088 [Puccinia graminis f. sp. tritici]|uniref:AGC protein kinase n=1 Tax=Puccinia graminis f. sp. tritici TaxID=56615 RepID=A0A5B0M4B4_PUCGR|nr:hypothetical protein PGTUg99_021992 [Puccinia graminis f. sp. tritici]KAA1071615.1 hypothetical protein PGT21_013088 [Puccinia graminis f. sp. tritici]
MNPDIPRGLFPQEPNRLFKPSSTVTEPLMPTESAVSFRIGSSDPNDTDYVRPTSPIQYPDYPNLSEYHLSRVLGTGSFGNVYLACRRSDRHSCAMKVMTKKDCAFSSVAGALKSEAKILASLDHPFVIRIESAFQNQDHLFLGLQVATNGTFHDYLEAYAPMDPAKAKFYICQLIMALDYIHEKNIVHGDVNPNNIFVSESGYLKLGDFGLARDTTRDELPNSCFGTVHFMAPEMIRGEDFGPSIDWWALGVIMYLSVFACYPFDVASDRSYQRFHRDNNRKLKLLICAGQVELPFEIDYNATELLKALLSNSAESRNFSMAHLINGNIYLQEGVNWKNLLNRVYISPFPPPRPPVDPNHHDETVDYSITYLDRQPLATEHYGGFFNDFYYVRTPWQVQKEGQTRMLIPSSSDAETKA